MKLNEKKDNDEDSTVKTEEDQRMANFEFQTLNAIQERQKKLNPEVFRKVKGEEKKS